MSASRDRTALDVAKADGFEPRDVPPRGVAVVVGGLLLGIVLSAGLVAGLIALLPGPRPRPTPTALETAPLTPPAPRLELLPQGDRAAIEAAARRRIEGYGPAAGRGDRARIPIERAMALLAGHGWPDPDRREESAP